ncbi:hypothetical protein ABGB09_12325 [Streptomyces sp. B8F3]|uniref:hypothetical protein n=1 Tax=Streptomyces sp. B8F3 TaxID=3153573 RepID=UPI00325F46BA
MSLPNVIDTRSLRAHREVEAMREVWERGRGAEWAPRPEVAAAARAEAGTGPRYRPRGRILRGQRLAVGP